MKINKYISVDEEIFRLLAEETNASDLINELLKAHYNQKQCENLSILQQKLTEIKRINKENRKKERQLCQKIDKINQKNKEFFENVQQRISKELLNKLKKLENLDYDTALSLSQRYDLHKKGIGGVKLINIWKEVRKNG